MKKIYLIIIGLFTTIAVFAQSDSKTFTPSGAPFVKVFTNYHYTNENGNSLNAFEINRAYFGYAYNLSKHFSTKLSLDVGNPGVGKFSQTAYLKNAYFQYKNDRLTTKFGLIGLNQFKLQEKMWDNRYIYKSFMDSHKFGSSADLGFMIKYKIHDILSMDLTITNGEGYKSIESDSIFKYALGATINPFEGFTLRAYYDIMGLDTMQNTLAFYAGYKKNNLSIGAEYNKQINHRMITDNNLNGISFYASYQIKKFKVFGRFDQLTSNILTGGTNPWNNSKDGNLIITGFEYNPIKGIKLSPNYQLWSYADGSTNVNTIALNCEIKF